MLVAFAGVSPLDESALPVWAQRLVRFLERAGNVLDNLLRVIQTGMPGGGKGPSGHSPYDVSGVELRSSCRRRKGGRNLPHSRQ
jgi:hypothetical protein